MRSVWWRALPLCLVGLLGLIALIFTAPEAAPVKVTANLLQTLGAGLGAAYLFLVVRTFNRDEPVRSGWLRLALGMAANCLGFLIYGVLELSGLEDPFPSVADFFWLITYPLALYGIADLARQYRSSGLPMARPRLAPVIFVAALAATVAWLMVPMAANDDVPLWHRALLVAYPVGDVILIGAAAYMAELMAGFGRGALTWPWIALVAGFLVMASTDLVYALLDLHGLYQTGSPVDAGWVLSGVLIGFGGFQQWRIMTRGVGREGCDDAV
ncbi:MAG TPA: hypothetical protein VNT75_12210 [Symbiobacteriaceae bacterium]|nr:hypothetical protein [Symbiobacteriaceae bacterium]